MKDRFDNGLTLGAFIEAAANHQKLWEQRYRRASLPEEVVEAAHHLSGKWHLLALTEDWCGDGVNSLPVVARLAEASPNLELRILRRDENPDLMDAHLTGRSRSIPVILVLDEDFHEVGWWGPRPGPLQDLFLNELKYLPQEERAKRIQAWYARDKGRTLLAELLALIPVAV